MKTFVIAVSAVCFLIGCSKKSADADAEAAPEAAAAAAPAPAAARGSEMDAMVTAALAELEAKVKAQQFDGAVGSLVMLKDMPRTPEEEAVFRQQLRATSAALGAKALAGDQAALESQRALGTMMLGR